MIQSDYSIERFELFGSPTVTFLVTQNTANNHALDQRDHD